MIPEFGKFVQSGKRISVLVPQLISTKECASLLSRSERIGYKPALVNQRDGSQLFLPEFRHSLRVSFVDNELSERLFNLVKHTLPFQIRVPETPAHPTCPEKETWRLLGLNSHFRFNKYVDVDGHHFKPHVDMSVRMGGGLVHGKWLEQRSFITMQLYLNDDYSGGDTSLHKPPSSSSDSEWYDIPNVTTGDVLFFDHKIYHKANQVELGTKYTLRTDVVYEKL